MNAFKLNEEKKVKPGFVVPENYFEQRDFCGLSNPPKQLNPFNLKWTWTAAAVLVIGLSITYFTFQVTDSNEIDAQLAENYLLHEADLTSYEYADYLSESELTALVKIESNTNK
ncbi:MAG: hypothetical protein FGM16_07690 [Flavobacterium sp.]|nr:hypothetical protein [Flavobacterium sp.]